MIRLRNCDLASHILSSPMAEVLAAAAAIIQFADVAFRLSTQLGDFCSEVRDVPERFRLLQADLRQQAELAKLMNGDHLPAFATIVASSTVDELLREYSSLVEELGRKLEKLLAKKHDGPLQRVWSGLRSARKKDEVELICDRLEQKKSSLSMWLNSASL